MASGVPSRRWLHSAQDASPLFGLGSVHSTTRTSSLSYLFPWLIVVLLCATLLFTKLNQLPVGQADDLQRFVRHTGRGHVFVSYSYFEKDAVQKSNFEFFILSAIGIGTVSGQDRVADYSLVINGDMCTPCGAFDGVVGPRHETGISGVAWTRRGPGLVVLQRSENEGMDFAAHNVSMTLAMSTPSWVQYKYFVFLNSSVKGPFMPKYYRFHWTEPFLSLITAQVKAISSSLVCLPAVDAGGPGPRLESWAFAIDKEGLQHLIVHGVFWARTCKLCSDGVVVQGEYGISSALLSSGFSFDTLMYKYAHEDWSNSSTWQCNDQVHPSRHGTYDGISMHPFEVVFVKSSWHVGEPFVDKYSVWQSTKLQGGNSAAGAFNERLYRYAITPQAQEKHPLIEKAYQVDLGVV